MKNCIKSFILSLLILAPIVGFSQLGIASYYSDDFHGRTTASGEKYDKNAYTAAHKELPFGTMVRVTRLDNKRSVTVKINDRGPYIKGRIIDLSKTAAEKLDMIRDGQVEVKVEVVNGFTPSAPPTDIASTRPPAKPATTAPAKKPATKPATTKPATVAKATPAKPAAKPQPKVVVTQKPTPPAKASNPSAKATVAPKKETLAAKGKTTKAATATSAKIPAKKAIPVAYELVKSDDYQKYDLYKVQVLRPEKKGFGVQVASFSLYENVMKKIAELQGSWFENVLVKVEESKNKKPVYKIILGPFSDQKTANSYKKNIKKKHKLNGFVVDLSKK